jgi:hypothetical protein
LDAAASLLVEAGPRNYRADATFGFNLSDLQRLKVTGEYLSQDIDYSFSTGIAREWVQQGAAGLDYQHNLSSNGLNYIDVGGYYSHAPNKTLDPTYVTYMDIAGNTFAYTNFRRIAGSNAYGISPSITLNPWQGLQATLAANYDNVHYDNQCITQQQSDGFGGTLTLNQQLGRYLQVNLSAGARAPFNTYQASIRYLIPSANLSLGIMGNYTDGKDSLPDTSLAGVELTYIVDKAKSTNAALDNRNTSVTAWVQKPAVYMPQVLAITEDCLILEITPPCPPPVFSGIIPNLVVDYFDPDVVIDAGGYFTGTNLVFSATGLPSELSIDPTTGIISGTFPDGFVEVEVQVTATDRCGSAQSNSFTIRGTY